MSESRRQLGPVDVEVLLEKLSSPPEQLLLVGGQALNIWARLFWDQFPSRLKDPSLLTSKDVDFVADSDSVSACARAWNGTAYFPDGSHHSTPSIGKVVIQVEGEEQEIDFLSAIFGADRNQLLKHTVYLEGNEKKVEIPVMHPLDCMHSRLANIYSHIGRRDEYEILRLEISIEVVRQFFFEVYRHDDSRCRNILDLAEAVFKTSIGKRPRYKNYPFQAYFEDEIDIFSAIPHPGQYSIFPLKFKEIRFPKMEAQVNTIREKKKPILGS